jgi:hypothetical protein
MPEAVRFLTARAGRADKALSCSGLVRRNDTPELRTRSLLMLMMFTLSEVDRGAIQGWMQHWNFASSSSTIRGPGSVSPLQF